MTVFDSAMSLAIRACAQLHADERAKARTERDGDAVNALCRAIIASAIESTGPIDRVRAAITKHAPTVKLSER